MKNKKQLFEKRKFKNKNNVSKFRAQIMNKEIALDKLPKDVLLELLLEAVDRIDKNENIVDGFDERDLKDIWCDMEFIVDDLFASLEEQIKLDFIYK